MTKRPVTIEGTLMRYRHLLSPLVLLLSLGGSLAAQEAERSPFELTTATIEDTKRLSPPSGLRIFEFQLAELPTPM